MWRPPSKKIFKFWFRSLKNPGKNLKFCHCQKVGTLCLEPALSVSFERVLHAQGWNETFVPFSVSSAPSRFLQIRHKVDGRSTYPAGAGGLVSLSTLRFRRVSSVYVKSALTCDSQDSQKDSQRKEIHDLEVCSSSFRSRHADHFVW